jgi:hypothetical protein
MELEILGAINFQFDWALGLSALGAVFHYDMLAEGADIMSLFKGTCIRSPMLSTSLHYAKSHHESKCVGSLLSIGRELAALTIQAPYTIHPEVNIA